MYLCSSGVCVCVCVSLTSLRPPAQSHREFNTVQDPRLRPCSRIHASAGTARHEPPGTHSFTAHTLLSPLCFRAHRLSTGFFLHLYLHLTALLAQMLIRTMRLLGERHPPLGPTCSLQNSYPKRGASAVRHPLPTQHAGLPESTMGMRSPGAYPFTPSSTFCSNACSPVGTLIPHWEFSPVLLLWGLLGSGCWESVLGEPMTLLVSSAHVYWGLPRVF